MKAMLSQPMAGKSEEEIKATRKQAIKVLEEKGYEIVNTLFTDEWYSDEHMKERCGTDSALLLGKEFRKNVSMSRSVLLQGLGTDARLSVET